MKRDMNLIRLLLLEVEGEEPKPNLSAYSKKQQIYHLAILIEAGLIKGKVISDGEGDAAAVHYNRLTWCGHEFLDTARDEENWSHALGRIAKTGIAVTLPIISEILTGEIKKRLGLPN